MKFEINQDTKEKEIIECAKHIYAWLAENKKLPEPNYSVSLLALANGEIRPETPTPTAVNILKDAGYKVIKEL